MRTGILTGIGQKLLYLYADNVELILYCIVSNNRQNRTLKKSDIATLKFKSKIQLQMGTHILWKVNIKVLCMLAKMGPHVQSVLTKARNNFCLTKCAGPLLGQGERAMHL